MSLIAFEKRLTCSKSNNKRGFGLIGKLIFFSRNESYRIFNLPVSVPNKNIRSTPFYIYSPPVLFCPKPWRYSTSSQSIHCTLDSNRIKHSPPNVNLENIHSLYVTLHNQLYNQFSSNLPSPPPLPGSRA